MSLFRSAKGDLSEYRSTPELPPSQQQSEYPPPLGPPPSHEEHEYAPPPGPPPLHQESKDDPPPYHDWTSIPDTALLPPPPSLGHKYSQSSNATRSEADRAHEYCRQHNLIEPHQPTQAQVSSVRYGDVRLLKPNEYSGYLLMPGMGTWSGSSEPGSKDSCFLTTYPLYFAFADSPNLTRISKTIYFEVRVRSLGRGQDQDECSIALGFCAIPYPQWRMPGWERGSLAVHSDDGRRYVNDTWGGKDFTSPINAGSTVGIGMTFSPSSSPPDYQALQSAKTPLQIDIFFTRNGKEEGGWNLHEELDADNEHGITGLDGQYDLYGAIGVFGGVDFEASFNSRDWLYQPN